MPEINTNNQTYNLGTGTPLYGYANTDTYKTPDGQTVNITSPYPAAQSNVTSPIYQYPTSSIYTPAASTQGQAQGSKETSGVNIYIYNPSAIGGQSSPAVTSCQYPQQEAAQPVANTPISENTEPSGKTKQVAELTDDYVKTLEGYLRSDDKSVRRIGIQELIKRFEEDKTRYDDEALTALLNIALQDSAPENRLLAMSPIAGSSAHGDENTIELLKGLTESDKLYGQEAKMATDALIKSSQTMTSIPDDSPVKSAAQLEEDKQDAEKEEV